MTTTDMPRLRRTAVSAAVLIAGALAVTGCAGASDTASDSRSASSTSGAASSGATTTAASNDALTAAAATALDTVGSGTVISIEQEQNGTAWEVLVVTADRAEHEVHTDASGEETTGTPRVDDSDAEDRAENQRFVDAAEIDVVDAAGRLQDTVAGTVTELGLDDHAGTIVWEGDVRDSSGTKHSIRIDACSGDVVTNTVDTDD